MPRPYWVFLFAYFILGRLINISVLSDLEDTEYISWLAIQSSRIFGVISLEASKSKKKLNFTFNGRNSMSWKKVLWKLNLFPLFLNPSKNINFLIPFIVSTFERRLNLNYLKDSKYIIYLQCWINAFSHQMVFYLNMYHNYLHQIIIQCF